MGFKSSIIEPGNHNPNTFAMDNTLLCGRQFELATQITMHVVPTLPSKHFFRVSRNSEELCPRYSYSMTV